MKRLVNKQLVKCANVSEFVKLTKLATNESETIKAIDLLVNDNDSSTIDYMYEDIMVENRDCLYNGVVYRKVILPTSKFFRLKNVGENYQIAYNKKDVLNKCYTTIAAGNPQSTSKSLECCQNFEPENNDGVEVIITFNCSQGLDILALASKYAQIMSDLFNKTGEPEYETNMVAMNEIVQEYANEQEVFCIIPNNYMIYSINGVEVDNLEDPITKNFIRG